MINSWDTEESLYIIFFVFTFLDYCYSDERMERGTKKMWTGKKDILYLSQTLGIW